MRQTPRFSSQDKMLECKEDAEINNVYNILINHITMLLDYMFAMRSLHKYISKVVLMSPARKVGL